jgi:hypothetical protein
MASSEYLETQTRLHEAARDLFYGTLDWASTAKVSELSERDRPLFDLAVKFQRAGEENNRACTPAAISEAEVEGRKLCEELIATRPKSTLPWMCSYFRRYGMEFLTAFLDKSK